MRRFVAKHQTPKHWKNEEDPKLHKEVQSFIRTMVKPTMQQVLLVFDRLADKDLMFNRDNPNAEVQTKRLAHILVNCYGKENAKKA